MAEERPPGPRVVTDDLGFGIGRGGHDEGSLDRIDDGLRNAVFGDSNAHSLSLVTDKSGEGALGLQNEAIGPRKMPFEGSIGHLVHEGILTDHRRGEQLRFYLVASWIASLRGLLQVKSGKSRRRG